MQGNHPDWASAETLQSDFRNLSHGIHCSHGAARRVPISQLDMRKV
jgi:hypothetical protein